MMPLENLSDYRQELLGKNLFFTFNGPMSNDFVVQIGKALKQKMKINEVSKGTVLRVFTMVVEQTQNIINYSSEKRNKEEVEGENIRSGILSIGYDGKRYHVFCGNQIAKDQVGPLQARLEKIQSMDREQLKSHYKETLRGEAGEESRGAGLGFIEMARKSSEAFEFHFSEVDAEHSFFALKTVVSA